MRVISENKGESLKQRLFVRGFLKTLDRGFSKKCMNKVYVPKSMSQVAEAFTSNGCRTRNAILSVILAHKCQNLTHSLLSLRPRAEF